MSESQQSYGNEIAEAESLRIKKVYRERESSVRDLYAPWQPAENLMIEERKRILAQKLKKYEKFPGPESICLEIGYGKIGWLGDLISWGVREENLHGIELDSARAGIAQAALPNADLQVGDAAKLPWKSESFDLIVASTVFSSILNQEVRLLIAAEAMRVLKPGGAIIWYDIAVNNPRNQDIKGISKKDLKTIFPMCEISTKTVTLAPPLARLITPRSFALATVLSALPFLRTHLASLIIKNSSDKDARL